MPICMIFEPMRKSDCFWAIKPNVSPYGLAPGAILPWLRPTAVGLLKGTLASHDLHKDVALALLMSLAAVPTHNQCVRYWPADAIRPETDID